MLDNVNENKIENEPKVKALLIDNEEWVVRFIEESLNNNKNIVGVVCNTVEKAIDVILKYNPDILFLDNSLTSGGNEGLEIVEEIKKRGLKIEIYSITGNEGVLEKYGDSIKGNVQKNDYNEMEKIINESISGEVK